MTRLFSVLLGVVVAAATLARGAPSDGILPFVGEGSGFEQALAPRDFVFPRDHGAHPSYRHEWWYLTGHLATAAGERFGFELTFFRIALARDAASLAPAGRSQWRAHDMYIAHFAVTDIDRGRFRSSERSARGALGLAGAQAEPLSVWVGDWSLARSGGAWNIEAAQEGYELRLAMTPELAPVANGDHGLSQKSATPTDASYYYSIPRLSVHGELLRDGKRLSVAGHAWLDREWGSGALAADEAGWDWFALQLADGSDLMFYSLRRRDGQQDAHSAGTWIAADGHVQALTSGDAQIKVQGSWKSPRGGLYPAAWRITVPAVAHDVELSPLLADQELNAKPRYWEGAVAIKGAHDGRTVLGEGYVELVGYARPP